MTSCGPARDGQGSRYSHHVSFDGFVECLAQEIRFGSGLSLEDWVSLREALLPTVHAKSPGQIPIPEVPNHLENHPLMESLRRYRRTGEKRDLDEAGRLLVPTDTPFGWSIALTK